MIAALGLSLLAGYAALRSFEPFDRHLPAFLLITSAQHLVLGVLFWRLWRTPATTGQGPRTGLRVLLLAAAMRALILPTAPALSDDVFRSVWDGRVQAAGINPYLHSPADPALASLRDSVIHPRINNPTVRTIYPPLSQWTVFGAHTISPTVFAQKAAFALLDLGVIALLIWLLRLRGRSPLWAALYAWNPVTVLEFSGSGHNDSLMLFFVLLAFVLNEQRRPLGSAAAFGAGFASKWIPVIMLPWLILRRRGWPLAVFLIVSAVLSVPFVIGFSTRGPGAPSTGSDWAFNPSLYALMRSLTGDPLVAKIVIGMILIAWAFWWARRHEDPARYLFGAVFALLLAGPVVYPWYMSWLLPFTALFGSGLPLLWAAFSGLSYTVLDHFRETGEWRSPAWVSVIQYSVIYGAVMVVAAKSLKRTTPQPARPSPLPELRVSVVIPALNEERAIGATVREIRGQGVQEVIVVDNGSTDRTASVAADAGASVVLESVRGYGRAVKRGIDASKGTVVVIMDGDRADHPEDLATLLEPIRLGEAHMVLGDRTQKALPGALMPQQRFGNWLTTSLIGFLFGFRFRDMGPFRAVRRDALERMGMSDPNFGWNVEMQVKALQLGLAVVEVPVSYRPRVGQSKISGTVKGTLHAGAIILWSIYDYGFRRPVRQACEETRR